MKKPKKLKKSSEEFELEIVENIIKVDTSSVENWGKAGGYERPIKALVSMSPENRDLIRQTLNFKWPKGVEGTPLFEAKEIIDHHLWGIIGRLHSKKETVIPGNLTWRQILIRVIEKHLEIVYKADATEEELHAAVEAALAEL